MNPPRHFLLEDEGIENGNDYKNKIFVADK